MEKTVPIRRHLDIQKEVKEDVSGLQDHDREITADAEILHRDELMRSEILKQQKLIPGQTRPFPIHWRHR
jgi:hypothetical protein